MHAFCSEVGCFLKCDFLIRNIVSLSKGSTLSVKDIRQVVTDYIKSQELASTENRR